MALLLLLISVAWPHSLWARINVVSLPGRDSVQLTIYNSVDLTVATERRALAFRKGMNRLEFSWANSKATKMSHLGHFCGFAASDELRGVEGQCVSA